jgi:predicted nucleotidyltransferase component of viral defense system
MITRQDLQDRVREWGLREDVVEKDYVLGWVLWGIGSDARLADSWVFKGGTCLKKCYIETYRFSEDLDFTILPGGPILPEELAPLIGALLQRVGEESGIDFSVQAPLLKGHPSGRYTEGRIYYQGPRGIPQPNRIKLDLSSSEQVVRPTVLRPITHAYPDLLPPPATVRCYSFEEVFGEKIRALSERGRPRDLYDIINLYRHTDLGAEPAVIRQVLQEKCDTKGVTFPTLAGLSVPAIQEELETSWASMLAHQLPVLPPFIDFWAALVEFFRWLEGTFVPPALATVPLAANELPIDLLLTPPTARTWGTGVPLETIRFAAANRLCVRLGYGGSVRVIEPYSLRQTRDGNLVIHAIRADSGEHRSYRVERIQSVEVTNQTFAPKYQIEFSATGPIRAVPTTTAPAPPRSVSRRPSSSAPRRSTHGYYYVVQCPYCQKKFRRTTRDTKLNEHKTKQGYRCSGSRGHGHIVDQGYK